LSGAPLETFRSRLPGVAKRIAGARRDAGLGENWRMSQHSVQVPDVQTADAPVRDFSFRALATLISMTG